MIQVTRNSVLDLFPRSFLHTFPHTFLQPGEELVEVEAGGLLELGQLEPLAGPRLANRLLLLQYIQADLSPHTGCPLPN